MKRILFLFLMFSTMTVSAQIKPRQIEARAADEVMVSEEKSPGKFRFDYRSIEDLIGDVSQIDSRVDSIWMNLDTLIFRTKDITQDTVISLRKIITSSSSDSYIAHKFTSSEISLNWDNILNSEDGDIILRGNAPNGPTPDRIDLFYVSVYEYNGNFAGNVSQVARGYQTNEIYYRAKFSGDWSEWSTYMNYDNDGEGSGYVADSLDSYDSGDFFNSDNVTNPNEPIKHISQFLTAKEAFESLGFRQPFKYKNGSVEGLKSSISYTDHKGFSDKTAIIFFGGQSNTTTPGGLVSMLDESENYDRSNVYINQLNGIANYNPFVNANLSNSGDFFGFEYRLTEELKSKYNRIIILKYRRGGTQINKNNNIVDFHPRSTGESYDEMMNAYKVGINAIRDRFPQSKIINLGYVWIHGEADASTEGRANNYATNVLELVDSLRANFDTLGITETTGFLPKLVISKMTQRPVDSKYRYKINEAQDSIALVDVNGVVMPTDDLVRYDSTHYDFNSTLVAGERLIQYFLDPIPYNDDYVTANTVQNNIGNCVCVGDPNNIVSLQNINQLTDCTVLINLSNDTKYTYHPDSPAGLKWWPDGVTLIDNVVKFTQLKNQNLSIVGASTGAIIMTLPSFNNEMITISGNVFNYELNKNFNFTLRGWLNSGVGGRWLKPTVKIESVDTNIDVSFGKIGANPIIQMGSANEVWSNLKVDVESITISRSLNFDLYDNFELSQSTDETGLIKQFDFSYPDYLVDAKTVQGEDLAYILDQRNHTNKSGATIVDNEYLPVSNGINYINSGIKQDGPFLFLENKAIVFSGNLGLRSFDSNGANRSLFSLNSNDEVLFGSALFPNVQRGSSFIFDGLGSGFVNVVNDTLTTTPISASGGVGLVNSDFRLATGDLLNTVNLNLQGFAQFLVNGAGTNSTFSVGSQNTFIRQQMQGGIAGNDYRFNISINGFRLENTVTDVKVIIDDEVIEIDGPTEIDGSTKLVSSITKNVSGATTIQITKTEAESTNRLFINPSGTTIILGFEILDGSTQAAEDGNWFQLFNLSDTETIQFVHDQSSAPFGARFGGVSPGSFLLLPRKTCRVDYQGNIWYSDKED